MLSCPCAQHTTRPGAQPGPTKHRVEGPSGVESENIPYLERRQVVAQDGVCEPGEVVESGGGSDEGCCAKL